MAHIQKIMVKVHEAFWERFSVPITAAGDQLPGGAYVC